MDTRPDAARHLSIADDGTTCRRTRLRERGETLQSARSVSPRAWRLHTSRERPVSSVHTRYPCMDSSGPATQGRHESVAQASCLHGLRRWCRLEACAASDLALWCQAPLEKLATTRLLMSTSGPCHTAIRVISAAMIALLPDEAWYTPTLPLASATQIKMSF